MKKHVIEKFIAINKGQNVQANYNQTCVYFFR